MILSIVLNIPCLPDLDLSPNRRRSRHFMQQAQDTKAERLNAGLLLAQARRNINPAYDAGPRTLATPVALAWTLCWPKGTRARDADGCADLCKPWIDAMKDLGWLPNDSPRYVRQVSYESIASSPKGPSMQLVIYGLRPWDD